MHQHICTAELFIQEGLVHEKIQWAQVDVYGNLAPTYLHRQLSATIAGLVDLRLEHKAC